MTELTEIKTAAESNRKAQVVENIPELLDENERIRSDTTALTRLALAVLYLSRLTESSLGREEFETASEFNEVRDELLETNIQVSETLSEYVRGEATADELIEKIDAFIRARDRYEETSQDLVKIQSDEVPGIISITGPQTDSVPKGERYTERLSIKNVGGDRVSSISLEAGGDPQVSASVSPSKIEGIDGDEEENINLVAETDVSGAFSISVSASSTEKSNRYSSDQYELRLLILSKQDYIQRAISQTESLTKKLVDMRASEGRQIQNQNQSQRDGTPNIKPVLFPDQLQVERSGGRIKLELERNNGRWSFRGQAQTESKKGKQLQIREKLNGPGQLNSILKKFARKSPVRGTEGVVDDWKDNIGLGLMEKLETIEKRLKNIKKKIDAGSRSEGKGKGRSGGPPGEAIDNQIDSVINQYDAFINQVEGLQKADKISEFRSVLFTQDAEDVIETLEKARKAEV